VGFTQEQKAMLERPLKQDSVRQRIQGGRAVSYIEGWHAIAEANRIFGFDGWKRETIYCKQVCCYQLKSSSGKENWKVGYEAKVRIVVAGDTEGPDAVREGTGHGQGTMGDLYDAIESAAKEAETDAMKRALMTLGNQFGLALYDKEQRNVEQQPKTNQSKDDSDEL
jgi:DNA repair and recombination protein RAD52